jgi:hypothetical protein
MKYQVESMAIRQLTVEEISGLWAVLLAQPPKKKGINTFEEIVEKAKDTDRQKREERRQAKDKVNIDYTDEYFKEKELERALRTAWVLHRQMKGKNRLQDNEIRIVMYGVWSKHPSDVNTAIDPMGCREIQISLMNEEHGSSQYQISSTTLQVTVEAPAQNQKDVLIFSGLSLYDLYPGRNRYGLVRGECNHLLSAAHNRLPLFFGGLPSGLAVSLAVKLLPPDMSYVERYFMGAASEAALEMSRYVPKNKEPWYP